MKRIANFTKDFKKGAMNFGNDLSALINCVILLFLYILGIGFSAILARLLRKTFFETKPSKAKKTYWLDFESRSKDTENYYQQF